MDQLLEDKLQSMQGHIEQLQIAINELAPYKETVEILTHKLATLSCIEDQAIKLKALEIADPNLAIKMLKKGQESYMYACKTLTDKTELIGLALKTDDPTIILTVSVFLYFSLDIENFGTLVMNNNFASKQFLYEYLLNRSFEEFRLVSQRYNRIHDLNSELLKRNFTKDTLNNYWESRIL